MRIACWITNAINTRSEYILFLSLALKVVLQGRPPVLPVRCFMKTRKLKQTHIFSIKSCSFVIQFRCHYVVLLFSFARYAFKLAYLSDI